MFKEVEMFPQLNCHSLGLCIYGEIGDTLLKVLQIIGNIYTSLSFRRDIENLLSIFFSIRLSFSQTLTIYRTAGEEKIDYFLFHCTTSSLSQTFRYLFATCMWDDNLTFLIAMLVFTRLLMRFTTLLNYHLIDWLMMQCSFIYLMIWF